MHGNAWGSLLRHIPPHMHDQLMIMTSAGTEIAVSTILQISHEYLAFKGRLSGSQEQGRLFFLPYHHLDYLGFYREVKDEEFQSVFGNLEVPAPPALAPGAAMPEVTPDLAPPPPEPEPEVEALPEPEPEPEPPPVAPSAITPPRSTQPIKSAILERFRSRSNPGTSLRPNGEG